MSPLCIKHLQNLTTVPHSHVPEAQYPVHTPMYSQNLQWPTSWICCVSYGLIITRRANNYRNVYSLLGIPSWPYHICSKPKVLTLPGVTGCPPNHSFCSTRGPNHLGLCSISWTHQPTSNRKGKNCSFFSFVYMLCLVFVWVHVSACHSMCAEIRDNPGCCVGPWIPPPCLKRLFVVC